MNVVYIKSVRLDVFVWKHCEKIIKIKLTHIFITSMKLSFLFVHGMCMYAYTLLGSMNVWVSWENGMQINALVARLFQNSFSL